MNVSTSGVLDAADVSFEGAASIWNVGTSATFTNDVFKSDVALAPGATLTLVESATINGTLTVDGGGVATTLRAFGDVTLDGVGTLVFGGNAKDVFKVVGEDGAKATLKLTGGTSIRGLKRLDGTNFELYCDNLFELDGAFVVDGDFTLGARGTLVFDVAGLKNYATLTCAGDAAIYGTLELQKTNYDFVPTELNSFKVLTASSLVVDAGAIYEGCDSFGGYAELTPEISSDALIFTVGRISGPKVVAISPSSAASTGATRPYLASISTRRSTLRRSTLPTSS